MGRGEPQQGRIDEHIRDHHLGAAEQFRAPQRQQGRITGARPHQLNNAFGFHDPKFRQFPAKGQGQRAKGEGVQPGRQKQKL